MAAFQLSSMSQPIDSCLHASQLFHKEVHHCFCDVDYTVRFRPMSILTAREAIHKNIKGFPCKIEYCTRIPARFLIHWQPSFKCYIGISGDLSYRNIALIPLRTADGYAAMDKARHYAWTIRSNKLTLSLNLRTAPSYITRII
jgi:hypothetical protein